MWAALLTLIAATPSRAVLHHTADPACPDAQQLEARVAARLGYSPFVPAGTEGALEVTTELRPHAARVVVVAPGVAPRQRSLTSASDDCRELTESLTLTLALAIDPQLAGVAPPPVEPAPAPAAAAPAPTAPAAPTPPTPPAVEEPAVPVNVLLSGGADGTVGISPAPTAGTSLGVGVRRGRLALLLEGRLVWASGTQVEGGTLYSSSLLASVLPCVHFAFAAACAQVTVGALQIDGALPDGRRQSGLLALAGGRLQAEWMFLRWLGVRGHLGVAAVLTRTTVLISGRTAWVTAPVAGELGAALLVSL